MLAKNGRYLRQSRLIITLASSPLVVQHQYSSTSAVSGNQSGVNADAIKSLLPTAVAPIYFTQQCKYAADRASFSNNVVTVFDANGRFDQSLMNRPAKFGSRLIIPNRCDPYWICDLKNSSNGTMLVAMSKRFISMSSSCLAAHQPFTLKTVEDRIMLVLRLYDKIDAEKLTLDTHFFKDAGLDSLDFVEVIVALEDEFQFEIPDGDSDKFQTPRDILQYICDKMDVYD